jgi:hypothetical protein
MVLYKKLFYMWKKALIAGAIVLVGLFVIHNIYFIIGGLALYAVWILFIKGKS